ncbi:dachshund homolog 1-like [Salvelinus fontinalis]|uniref:dachshund homolog 1-like n=1 Tax=Salvelinus fontinalis TaxID=8038 RepID=UPI002484E627|nr:dachshund homolog 1-like [Salvelinus fontinalis]XP_055771399.1 dachshund homolog 1-like [Salvelinus fontinalis]
MASPAALMPSVPLVQPPPIQTSPATNSPPPATTSSSPSPSIAPTGLNPFSADLLPVPVGSPGVPVDVLPGKPVYSTPSPVENTPQNNEVKMVEVRGAKLASFTVKDNELICLPQAFDLFLKHLVGGLHTVYTKLKRLQITPVVCNVEQVRILRGLGAIQPGVNRCKLISRRDFETLYNDCTNAR